MNDYGITQDYAYANVSSNEVEVGGMLEVAAAHTTDTNDLLTDIGDVIGKQSSIDRRMTDLIAAAPVGQRFRVRYEMKFTIEEV